MTRILRHLTAGDWWLILLAITTLICVTVSGFALGIGKTFDTLPSGQILSGLLIITAIGSFSRALLVKRTNDSSVERLLIRCGAASVTLTLLLGVSYFLGSSELAFISLTESIMTVLALATLMVAVSFIFTILGLFIRQIYRQPALSLLSVLLLVLIFHLLLTNNWPVVALVEQAIVNPTYQSQVLTLLLGLGVAGLAITLAEVFSNRLDLTQRVHTLGFLSSHRLLASAFSSGWSAFIVSLINFLRDIRLLGAVMVIFVVGYLANSSLAAGQSSITSELVYWLTIGSLVFVLATAFGRQAHALVKISRALPVSLRTVKLAYLLGAITTYLLLLVLYTQLNFQLNMAATLQAFWVGSGLLSLGFFTSYQHYHQPVGGVFSSYWPAIHVLAVSLILSLLISLLATDSRLWLALGVLLISLYLGLYRQPAQFATINQ